VTCTRSRAVALRAANFGVEPFADGRRVGEPGHVEFDAEDGAVVAPVPVQGGLLERLAGRQLGVEPGAHPFVGQGDGEGRARIGAEHGAVVARDGSAAVVVADGGIGVARAVEFRSGEGQHLFVGPARG